MEQVLLVIHVMIAAALIGMVLLQRSETDGFGLSGGSGSNLMSGRSAANLMTRTTAILAALFIANSLILSIMAAHHKSSSLIDSLEQEPAVVSTVPAAEGETPVVEKAPVEAPKAKIAAKPAVPNADAAPKPAKKIAPKAPAAAERSVEE